MIKIPKKTTKKKTTNAKKKIVKKPATIPSKQPSAKQPSAVNKKMTIGEVIQKHPDAMEIMINYGLHCIGCHVAAWETIEQGCSAHGLSSKEIDKIIDEINKAVQKKKK